MSEEGSGGSTGLELAVLAGMVLLAFPIYRTVVRFLEADMGITLWTAMLGYAAVVVACYAYYRCVGVLMHYLHLGSYSDDESSGP